MPAAGYCMDTAKVTYVAWTALSSLERKNGLKGQRVT